MKPIRFIMLGEFLGAGKTTAVARIARKLIDDGHRIGLVGSCTDLVATVIEPLRHLHGDRYEIAPLVLCA